MNIWKKLVMFICLILIFSSCTVFDTRNQSLENEKVGSSMTARQFVETRLMPGDMVELRLGIENFQDFLEEPSIDFLYERGGVSIYRISDREGYIQTLDFARSTATISTSTREIGIFRIGAWPISIELINFMNYENTIKNMLVENGIEYEIIDYAMISHGVHAQPVPPGSRLQMGIWIHTSGGDFFLQHDRIIDEQLFTFHFFTLEEYRQRYGR